MRSGFTLPIVLILGLALVTLFAFTGTHRLTSLPIPSPSTDPHYESYVLLNKIIDARNKEDTTIETSADANLLGVQSGKNYTALVYDLGSSTVVTDTGTNDNCGNDCYTKPLAQYVKEQAGRGGMNGTYFCPPDYAWCAGKKNSFDFPVWNIRNRKWIQSDQLFWGGRGMMVFRPGSAQFFPNSAAAGAPSDITGGIVNYPSLVSGGNVIVNDGNVEANLKTKATRSGIGFGSGKLFLIVARSSSVRDLANIFKSLGATDALNLDGGGSAALYEAGRYRAGPGRSLPTAIIVR